jgi:hypothetical protein
MKFLRNLIYHFHYLNLVWTLANRQRVAFNSIFSSMNFSATMLWLFINELSAFVVGLFFNVALIYLIQKRTPSLMRSYAIILRIHAISDLLFDIVNFVTTTQCITLRGRFYFLNGGIHSAYWTSTMAFFSVETYLWIVVYVPLGLVPLDFFYRLRAVC